MEVDTNSTQLPKKTNEEIEEADAERRRESFFLREMARKGISGLPTRILPFLFLGSKFNANNPDQLLGLKIKKVINTALEVKTKFKVKKIDYYFFEVLDAIEDQGQNQFDLFEKVFSVIDEARKRYKKKKKRHAVLVHCARGRSRSSSICIAYLMSRLNWSLSQSYQFVKRRRWFIGPHFDLQLQLISFELFLHPHPVPPLPLPTSQDSTSSSSNSREDLREALNTECFLIAEIWPVESNSPLIVPSMTTEDFLHYMEGYGPHC